MQTELEAHLNRIYTTLVQLCPAPLTPDGIHGVMAGVALSPRPAVPNTWLPLLYNMNAGMPEFATHEQARSFLDTSVLAYNAVVAALTAEQFSFNFAVDEESAPEIAGRLQAWCVGFIKGLRCTGVESGDYDQDFINLMSPIAFCARPDFFKQEGSIEETGSQTLRIAEDMPANLIALRNYFFLHQQRQNLAGRGTTPGRNDPCSCGSGKKYKHCCGKAPTDA